MDLLLEDDTNRYQDFDNLDFEVSIEQTNLFCSPPNSREANVFPLDFFSTGDLMIDYGRE